MAKDLRFRLGILWSDFYQLKQTAKSILKQSHSEGVNQSMQMIIQIADLHLESLPEVGPTEPTQPSLN
jgi:hypothetical protein